MDSSAVDSPVVRNEAFKSTGHERPIMWGLGGPESRLVVHAEGSETGLAISVAEHLWPAGDVGGLHSHNLEAEGFYILEGEVTVTMPDTDQVFVAGPGEFVWHPRGGRHSYAVGADAPARVLQFLVPGSRLVPGFFRDLAEGRAGDLTEPGAVDELFRWSHDDYGVTFFPPEPDEGGKSSQVAETDPENQQGGTQMATPEAGTVPFRPVSSKPFKSDPSQVQTMQIGRGMMTDVKMIFHAFGHQTGNAFGLTEIFWGPGDVAGPHVHNLEDEGFYILEGELTLHVAGAGTIPARAGEFVWAPRNVPHYYSVTGEEGARVLVFEVPGGTLTDFFYRTATEGRGAEIESDEGLEEFVGWCSENFGIDFMDPDDFPEEN